MTVMIFTLVVLNNTVVSFLNHEMEGGGTPVAEQLNVTLPEMFLSMSCPCVYISLGGTIETVQGNS